MNTKKKNLSNLDDFSYKTDPDYLRQMVSDDIYNSIENIDWKKESTYHNTYYKGKGNYGIRELRMNNKKWHEINK